MDPLLTLTLVSSISRNSMLPSTSSSHHVFAYLTSNLDKNGSEIRLIRYAVYLLLTYSPLSFTLTPMEKNSLRFACFPSLMACCTPPPQFIHKLYSMFWPFVYSSTRVSRMFVIIILVASPCRFFPLLFIINFDSINSLARSLPITFNIFFFLFNSLLSCMYECTL